jgi:hypothetical protein
VAVNLEVVRGRSARGADASAIAPFAATATSQLEVAAAATEALLGFARAEPEPVDVAAIVGRLAQLLSVRGQEVIPERSPDARVTATSAPADLVRAVVARSVLSALQTGGAAPCEISVGDGIFLRVTGGDASAPSLDPELAALASAWGVRVMARGRSLQLSFPLATDANPHAPDAPA